jgi:hypothetical protein
MLKAKHQITQIARTIKRNIEGKEDNGTE